jgi:hypothetical protein
MQSSTISISGYTPSKSNFTSYFSKNYETMEHSKGFLLTNLIKLNLCKSPPIGFHNHDVEAP